MWRGLQVSNKLYLTFIMRSWFLEPHHYYPPFYRYKEELIIVHYVRCANLKCAFGHDY